VTVVRIPSPLYSYTSKPEVEAQGATVGEVLADLDRRYPGLRFRVLDEQDRIRSTIVIAVSGNRVSDLSAAVGPKDVLTIIAALSGG
jgi:molybdopterin converting factor small subunit